MAEKLCWLVAVLASLGSGIPARAAATVWAGSQGGLFKSTNSGANWQPVAVPVTNPLLKGIDPQTPNIFTLSLDPQQPATIYFVGRMQGSSGLGFYRSIDNGASWTATVLLGVGVLEPVSSQTVWILVDPVLTNVIYLGTLNAVWKTVDYGATWTKLTMPLVPNSGGNTAVPTGLSVDPNTSGVLYLSYYSNIFTSTDFGVSWNELPRPAVQANPRLGNVVVPPGNSSVLYVGVADAGSLITCSPSNASQVCGLLRSPDGGRTWTGVGPEGGYNEVVFDPRTSDMYVTGTAPGIGQAVFKSVDNGLSWNPINNQTAHQLLLADPSVSGTLLTHNYNSNAMYRSADGGMTFAAPEYLPITGIQRDIHVLAAPRVLGNVSAAGYQSGPMPPESIVAAFGYDLATAPLQATTLPLQTNLGGTTVTVTDSAGISRQALLFYVSPAQVNYEIPAGTAPGVATVVVKSADGVISRSPLGIAPAAPGLFTLNSAGLVAAYVVRVSGGNTTYTNVYQVDASNAIVPLPIDLGPDGDQVFLILFGTGVRGAAKVTAVAGGADVPVPFFGAVGAYAGEDQINIGPLPRSLAGKGSVPLIVTADGKPSNAATVTIR